VAREYQEQVEAEIMGLKHIKPEDRFVVADFAVTATGLRIADEYIAAQGPFTVDEEGEVAVREAILDLRHRLSASLMRQADALGLTPQARARLKLADGQGGRGGLASLLLEAEQIQAARRAAEEEATVEGDFELQVEGTAGDG
jgi:P27 family predicted phage terminase small subunit